MRPVRQSLTYAGIVTAMAGFALLAYTWGKVAALLNVALQLPYVVSGGFTGIGLVIVGMALVNIDARRADAARRDRQLAQLADLLRALAGQARDDTKRDDTDRMSVATARRAPQ